jgi:hypothetical protein
MSSNFDLIGKKLKFKATYRDDKNQGSLDGKIEFLKENDFTVYASWNVFDGSTSIAGISSNFFSKKADRTNDFVIKQVVNQIEKYRVGRKCLFQSIVVISSYSENEEKLDG